MSDELVISKRGTKYSHDEIGALYCRGMTAQRVAQHVGCSVSLVLTVVKKQQLNRSRKLAHAMTKITVEQKEQISGYRKRGWSWIRIAFVMKISAKTLIKQCRGSDFDKLTNCAKCQRVIVNAHQTQKYCDECGAKVKAENARFYNEKYQKRLRGEIEEGEE